jgi:CheY-like chemotaxis protein
MRANAANARELEAFTMATPAISNRLGAQLGKFEYNNSAEFNGKKVSDGRSHLGGFMQVCGALESPGSDIRTLLIVDDEYAVVCAIREALGDLKCRVITTTDPTQALQILETDGSVDLLITDLFMPAMDGGTLLKKGRQIRPGLSAVLTTGAASGDQLRRWRARGEFVVAKPWLEGEFAAAVEKALKRRNG